MDETILDNPAWAALNTVHAAFAQGRGNTKRYRPGILPFIGCREGSIPELDELVSREESLYSIGDLPVLPAGWITAQELPCAQMLLRSPVPMPSYAVDAAVVLLDEADATDMFSLINSVQPGYYHAGTRLLGSYYGIKKEGRLVAMAGERMRITGFSELSAICTLPGYTGLGYAQKLIAQLCSLHAAAGIVSFLHVALSNERAIRLYEHMGFRQRRTIIFRRIGKQ